MCEADVFVVAWGARCGSGRDHGRRRRNQTKSKGDARVVAGRAGEGRHQLRRDYKKKRERERELGGRIEGGNRHKKKEGGRPLSPRLFFIQMGKRTVGNLTKSTKHFLFVLFFSFVSFVLLLFWSWPFFFFFSLDDFKTRKRRESDKWKRHLISFDSTTTRRK